MKTIGIIGGIGPESTIEYYRLIISSFLDLDQSGNYPKIIINSINMKKMLDLIGENRLGDVSFYLAAEVNKLAAAGADFAAMASNTPHIVFDQVEQATVLPMISIIKATCRETTNQGIKRVGLFGTKFTMQGGFYEKTFSQHQIEVMVPNDADQDYIHHKYMSELVKGIILDESVLNRLYPPIRE
jgi:aspartate racemase